MKNEDELPPVIQILLTEPPPVSLGNEDLDRYLRRLVPELRRQARWSRDNYEYPKGPDNEAAGRFVVSPSGSLDPFSRHAVCWHPSCRIDAATNLARTIGLHADLIVLPDVFTAHLIFRERFNDGDRIQFFINSAVLRRLKPVIDAGLIQFRGLMQGFCERHFREFEERVDETTKSLEEVIRPELTFKLRDSSIEIRTGRLYDPPLILGLPLSTQQRRRLSSGVSLEEVGVRAYAESLRSSVKDVLLEMHSAAQLDAVIFSSSRMDLLTLKELEGDRQDLKDIELWESVRSAQLPWIKDLSISQVLRVREEASTALPRLREMLVSTLADPGGDSTLRFKKLVLNLREQAAEVEAELKAFDPRRERRFRAISGVLGLTISLYGFAAGFAPPTVALGGLLSLLGLIHSSARKDEQEQKRITSRPGYVLVKAKELLQHPRSPGKSKKR